MRAIPLLLVPPRQFKQQECDSLLHLLQELDNHRLEQTFVLQVNEIIDVASTLPDRCASWPPASPLHWPSPSKHSP